MSFVISCGCFKGDDDDDDADEDDNDVSVSDQHSGYRVPGSERIARKGKSGARSANVL